MACQNDVMTDPRYPVGAFERQAAYSSAERAASIQVIEEAPARLRQAVVGLTDAQLDTSYRDGGWTVRQVVHHLPDSHQNAYTRFKLALTEDAPIIKPYLEQEWAKLPDAGLPVDVSLRLLEALHTRWVVLLRGMNDTDFARTYRHPESGLVRLDQALALYDWHSRNHTAHVTRLRERMGW
jgi:hypothetical protein